MQRFDSIRSPKGITAIVDYAHTPDALVNVLNAIHDVLEGKGKVITVVGAGGNRDKGNAFSTSFSSFSRAAYFSGCKDFTVSRSSFRKALRHWRQRIFAALLLFSVNQSASAKVNPNLLKQLVKYF